MKRTDYKFDLNDRAILAQLDSDPRMPASQIARCLGMKTRTVQQRIDRMVASQAIHFTVLADPKAFGYDLLLDLKLVSASYDDSDTIRGLLNTDGVAFAAYGPGPHDIRLTVCLRSVAEVRDFMSQMQQTFPGLEVQRSRMLTKIVRHVDAWRPGREDFNN